MMAIRTWLLGVIGTALLLNLMLALFPKGKYRTVANLISGLTLLLVMVRPVLETDFSTWQEVEADLTWQLEDTTQTYTGELETVISEKTAAYIQSKAAAMGIPCRAEVGCIVRDGVPFPAEVWMDIAYHEALAQLITEELAIERDHQHWREETP